MPGTTEIHHPLNVLSLPPKARFAGITDVLKRAANCAQEREDPWTHCVFLNEVTKEIFDYIPDYVCYLDLSGHIPGTRAYIAQRGDELNEESGVVWCFNDLVEYMAVLQGEISDA